MIETIVQYVHQAIEAATPWLVGTAMGFFVLWLIMLCYKAKPFARELKWFFSLTPWHKFIVICTVCFFTLWGGSKERGILPSGLIDNISSTMTRVVETIQLRTLPDNISSNAFAITDFAVDSRYKATAFGVGWVSNLFENVDSRNVDLFMSTNLAVNGWFLLGRYLMPVGTNSYEFTVVSNDVALACRSLYVDSFSRMAFFRFGLDFDSDGDGLTDAYENFVSFTDPTNPDTDGDGLFDSQELSGSIATNPLLYDTDEDGVGDGDEIAAGSNPHSSDTDEDGLLDVAEIGTMTAQNDDNFMWFDMSNGTDLLASSSTEDEKTWQIALPQTAVINEVCHTNALVCMNGVVHLLCPTNFGGTHYSGFGYSNLSNYEWSAMHVTIALCNSDLYACKTEWGSKILYGSVESDGRTFGVVEYRNIGLYSLRNAASNELMICQLIIPSDETNTVYVSYLCASNSFRSINLVAGIQCGGIPSCRPGEAHYNLTWPITSQFPEDGLTIKYSIGTGTNPAMADTDGDGFSDPEEIFTYHTNPFVADMDGDGLLDAEEFVAGTDHLNPDTDGDGIPDGWEVHNGTNPLLDDAMLDPDWDGLVNLLEYDYGTCPLSEDSDGDMLVDLREVATYTAGITNIPWFVFQPIKTVTPGTEQDRALFDCAMPFTNRLAGSRIELALADINGAVYFGTASTTNGIVSENGGVNLAIPQNKWCPVVAGYWSDLKTRMSLNSSISFGLATTNDEQYFVVEYSRIGTYSGNANEVTFQISIPRTTPDIAYVRYGDILDGRTSGNTTIGIQGGKEDEFPNSPRLNYYYKSVPPVLTNGFVLAFNFGTGGNPLVSDTDGDGLDDRIEAAIGTNPRRTDTDGDGFTDAEEIDYGMNPCSAIGVDGADGDLDGDGIANALEASFGTSLMIPDCDGDGLPDGTETGFITVSNGLPWLTFDVAEDCTTQLVYDVSHKHHVNRPFPGPTIVQGEVVTNLTFTSTGWLFLNRAGLGDKWRSNGASRFNNVIDRDTLAIAAYGNGSLSVKTNAGDRSTVVRYGTATHDGIGYVVLEYDNLYRTLTSSTTNSISLQVALPTNSTGFAYVRYSDVTGIQMDGGDCGIGMQTFDGKWLHSYCYDQHGKVYDGLCLRFVFGMNTDPLNGDSDGDGLLDGVEVQVQTSPCNPDTDGDGLPDGWEVRNGISPLSAMGDDGAAGDGDGDALPNVLEYEYGTDPGVLDSDSDGLADGREVVAIYENDDVPWLSISSPIELNCLASNQWECVDFRLPAPLVVQDEMVTNITIDAHGIIYLNKADHVNSLYARSSGSLENEIDKDCFVLAPYLSELSFADLIGPTSVKTGSATDGTNGYIVVEYSKMYYYPQWGDTNVVSFQVSIPTGVVDRVNVKYVDVYGDDMDGRRAVIGLQTFGFRNYRQYCYNDYEKVHDGLGLVFLLGYGTNPAIGDTDRDGLSDGDETNVHGCDPLLKDTDGDGLNDDSELTLGTSPINPDSDGDGLPDGWEHDNGLDPASFVGEDGASGDPDHDGLPNSQEFAQGGDPQNPDSDGDGLADGQEVLLGTSVIASDTDGDGLSDSAEVAMGTNPLSGDSDNDGLSDGWEVLHGYNPLVADNANLDTDGDGLADLEEQMHGTNPRATDTDGDLLSDYFEIEESHTDPTRSDTDGDGLLDKAERDAGLDPLRVDSDRDGLPDGWETQYSINPLNSEGDDGANGDLDGDGVSNIDEYRNNCNPRAKDTDGDGVNDDVEIANGSNPADASDGGNPPSADLFREISFNITGDWAAWEMVIEGLGPDDTRTMRITMGAPASPASTTEKLRKNSSYRLSMRWLNCDGHDDHPDAPWYCWQALIDGKPSAQTFNDYGSARKDGVASLIVGNGWIAENNDGLLTAHIHEHNKRSGNVVAGKTALLHVFDIEHDLLKETDNKCNQIRNDTPKDDSSAQFTNEIIILGGKRCSFAAHRNFLYTAAAADNKIRVTERIKVANSMSAIFNKYADRFLCAAFRNSELVKGSQSSISANDHEAALEIASSPDAVAEELEIRVGIDVDGDGKLSREESYPLEVCKIRGVPAYATVKGISKAKYEQHHDAINGQVYFANDNPPEHIAPHARSFLRLFYEPDSQNNLLPALRPTGNGNVQINAFSNGGLCFAEWLTHNCGAVFTESGDTTISRYSWNRTTEVSRFMAQRTPFALKTHFSTISSDCEFLTDTGKRLLRFYKDHVKALAEEALRDAADGAEVTMPQNGEWYEQGDLVNAGVFTSLSPQWVPGLTLDVGKSSRYQGKEALFVQLATSNPTFDDFDAFGTIGRGRVLNPRYRFVVRKIVPLIGFTRYEVASVQFECSIEDLYDFNYEDGELPANAAALQIGYREGVRGTGKIFMHHIDISTSYPWPFLLDNYLIP